jgi:hypothetical protein
MKNTLAALLLGSLAISVAAQSSHYVRPHVTRDGTYVQGHQQTNPDSTRLNNWSTQGNVNPYTGQLGTVDPYNQPQSSQRAPSSNPYQPQQCGYTARGQYVCR